MQRTTTTAADIAGDVEQNVLARQMFGQRFAFRTSAGGLGDDYKPEVITNALASPRNHFCYNSLTVPV